MRIGYIGLGDMGGVLARRLQLRGTAAMRGSHLRTR